MCEERKLPSYVISQDIFPKLREFLYGYNRILIVGCYKGIESCCERLNTVLKEAGSVYDYLLYGKECSWEDIESIKKKAEKGFDLIIGVGGGKALDTAKAAGELTGLPVATIPTIAATCAAVTPLSVIYNEDGTFRELLYLDKPPVKAFIDLTTLSSAPYKYLRAGMGDTLAKFYEVSLAVESKSLNTSTSLGVSLLPRCRDTVFLHGDRAILSNREGVITQSFKEVVTANIVTTGLVSCLIDEEYNGSVAHAVALGFSVLEGFEERVLHGDAVAYGILVQMQLMGDSSEYDALTSLYSSLSLPTGLADIAGEGEFLGSRDEIYTKILSAPNIDDLSFMNEASLREYISPAGGV